MTARTAAMLIGVIFIAVGLLGFIDNPIIYDSDSAIFYADKFHNMVHIGSGILFILIALAARGTAGGFCILFGVFYLAIGVIGLMNTGTKGMGKVLGILHVNGADNVLHVVLGLVILIMGISSRKVVPVTR
jgi:hypothetical protein